MKSDFLVALTQLAAERNLPREIVLFCHRGGPGVCLSKGQHQRRPEHIRSARPRQRRRKRLRD